MDTILKILLGGAAVFLVFGAPRVLKKGGEATPPGQVIIPDDRQPGTPSRTVPARDRFPGAPRNQIASRDWLEANGNLTVEMQAATLTYYLLANSDRCHIDSVDACLKQKVLAAGIDAEEFQYTYFLDHVLRAGSGFLNWQGKSYVTNYTKLQRAGWQRGANSYRCSNFSFAAKNALAFIRQHLGDAAVFTPIEKAPAPNGLTTSGQEAVDWISVSVNARDFPLSVPDPRRRDRLAARYKSQNKREPEARSFIVIETRDGRLFLTEAMDTGSGVKPGWIDWRIGNTSAEIKYFLSLGRAAKAYCYTFPSADVTWETVLEKSRAVTRK